MTGIAAKFIEGPLTGQIRVINTEDGKPPEEYLIRLRSTSTQIAETTIMHNLPERIRTGVYTLWDNCPVRYMYNGEKT